MSDFNYAGDLSPTESWDLLKNENGAVMIDVRTDAEFSYVGVPDLSTIAKDLQKICWKVFPDMATNSNFGAEVEALGIAKDQPILFLCRSGVRSRAAADAITKLGYTRL